MPESWINLSCPGCEKQWTSVPTDLPALDADMHCADCGHETSTTEFLKTARDLEIVKSLAD